MTRLNEVKKHLRPGRVYRRGELANFSNAVDRHLKQLQEEGTLRKLSNGLYYYPKQTAFGEVPPDDKTLVRAFLKDDRFLLSSPNAYNALGVGTTQLYNQTVVYNHKRHEHQKLGGREFDFRRKPHFPKALTPEFLLVDLVNNMDHLAEDRDKLMQRVKERAASMSKSTLSRMVRDYGGAHAKKFFAETLADNTSRYNGG